MDATQFWAKVDRTGDCWLWLGKVGTSGYGRFTWNGRSQGAHRVSWYLTFGPTNLNVLHHCDNRLCVNPNHLFEGTYKDNMQDWSRKREQKLGMSS